MCKMGTTLGGLELGEATKSLSPSPVQIERFAFQLRGWFAIILLLICAGMIWCIAILAFAMGHALNVLRDLAKSIDNRRPPAG